jgi:hypothetical protein
MSADCLEKDIKAQSFNQSLNLLKVLDLDKVVEQIDNGLSNDHQTKVFLLGGA